MPKESELLVHFLPQNVLNLYVTPSKRKNGTSMTSVLATNHVKLIALVDTFHAKGPSCVAVKARRTLRLAQCLEFKPREFPGDRVPIL